MNQLKKLTKVIVMMVMLAIVTPLTLPISNTTVAQAAATIKLDKKNITLTAGKSTTLHIKGTKKKVTWSTSNKKIATVNKNGKVTAVTGGAISVTATVNKKKYSCKVKVIVAVNKAVKDAPFAAKEEAFDKLGAVMPKDWTKEEVQKSGAVTVYGLLPAGVDKEKASSNVAVIVQNTGVDAPDYNTVAKPYFAAQLTTDNLKALYSKNGMEAVTISDFKQSDIAVNAGTACKTELKLDYKVNGTAASIKVVFYDIYLNGYFVEIQVADNGVAVTPDVMQVGEYLLKTLQLTK